MSEPWIASLRQACEASSQSAVATRIGMSPAVVNQVLKGTYLGNLSNVQKRVEGVLMGVSIDCPIIGEIPLNICVDNQSRPFAATNPMRVRLHRACKACPNRRGS